MGTGKNKENHVRENVGWILFKTCDFYIFLKYTIVSLYVNLGIIYNVQCGLSYGYNFRNLDVK